MVDEKNNEITAKKAHYCLSLKGNQSTLQDDVHLYFEAETVVNTKTTLEKGHGRIEKREYFLETESTGSMGAGVSPTLWPYCRIFINLFVRSFYCT